MGCCCFTTLRGAAFFVASIHIYNGLECMLKFIAFPLVFTALHNKDEPETPMAEFIPGMLYAIFYFLLGCTIFRGIERDYLPGIKWGAIGYFVVEVVFFTFRVILGLVPTPTVPDVPKGEQPFEMNIYKTLNYFLFTIVGGLVYMCILFLYIQKLSTGRDEFAQFYASLTNRSGSNPPAPPPNPTNPDSQVPINNNQPPSSINPADPHTHSHHHSSKSRHHQGENNQPLKISNNPNPSGNPKESSHHEHGGRKLRGGVAPLQQPHHHHSGGSSRGGDGGNNNMPPLLPGGKDPSSPSSPMFPYFLLRRNSKMNSKSGPHERIVDEPPPQSVWHQPRVQSVSMLNRGDYEGGVPVGVSPRGGPVDVVGGGRSDLGERRLLSPSMLNHHQAPLPPPHQFQPIPPPFYSDSPEERREFIPPGFGSPTGSHYQQGGGYPPVPRGQESLYQKIPMSPGFDYCLR